MTPGALRVDFEWRVVPPSEPPRARSVRGVPGGVMVRGNVSAGRRGWTLSATASLRRRRLLVQVVARPAGDAVPRDLEEYDYELVVRGLTEGPVRVTVVHNFVVPGLPHPLPGESQFAGEVTVARPAVL